MLDIMYEAPSNSAMKSIEITQDLIEKRSSASIIQLLNKDKKPKLESEIA